MKKSFFLLAAALLTTSVLFANNTNPDRTDPGKKSNKTVAFDNIFLEDYEGEALFIDFEAVDDAIYSVNLMGSNEMLISHDDVVNLPANSIYEINIGELLPGNYLIELITANGISIHKKIKVK